MSRNERTIQESVSTGVGDLLVPQWRGRLHTWAFFATLPLGVMLLLVADGPRLASPSPSTRPA